MDRKAQLKGVEPLLTYKYERHGLCVTAKDRIPAADGLSEVLAIHISRHYLWDSSGAELFLRKILNVKFASMSETADFFLLFKNQYSRETDDD
jgi:hypothetical protein